MPPLRYRHSCRIKTFLLFARGNSPLPWLPHISSSPAPYCLPATFLPYLCPHMAAAITADYRFGSHITTFPHPTGIIMLLRGAGARADALAPLPPAGAFWPSPLHYAHALPDIPGPYYRTFYQHCAALHQRHCTAHVVTTWFIHGIQTFAVGTDRTWRAAPTYPQPTFPIWYSNPFTT